MKKLLPLALLLLLLSAPAWGGDTYQRVNRAGDALEDISAEEAGQWPISQDRDRERHPSEEMRTLSFILGVPRTLTLEWPDCACISIVVKGPECDITYEIRDGEIVLTGRLWKEPLR
jgi:hypothetical protein